MNYLILLFLFLLLPFSKSNGQCSSPQATEYLHGNDVRAAFRNAGDMFWDGVNSKYFVPFTQGQSSVSSIFAGSLWLGAYDDTGNLMVASQMYRSSGTDFWSGPLDTAAQAIDCSGFDKIWQVKGTSVTALLTDFNDNGLIDNPIDTSLLLWPGRGNAYSFAINGLQLPDQDLAPFFDRNSDSIYNPYHGDYPLADPNHTDVVADDLLWMVFNDNGNYHLQSNGQPLKVEVHLTAYAFYCTGDDLINQSIFTHHKIINKNSQNFHNLKIGLWTDFDLGCPNDDYIGTVSDLNTVYAYNQDNFDDTLCSFYGGYGTNPPVQAITLLNQNLTNSSYHVNSGSSPLGDPFFAIGYYRLLDGIWPNGALLSYGGDGYDAGSTNATPYVFPDNPNDSVGWSMLSASLSGYDQRAIACTTVDTLLSNTSVELFTAYSFHRDSDSNNLQNVNLMYQQIPVVQSFYNNGYENNHCSHFVSHHQLNTTEEPHLIKIYPNPAKDIINIELKEYPIESVGLYSLLGQLLYSQDNIYTNSVQLSVRDLPQGIYILKIGRGDKIWSHKVQILD
jgi:hypothetical protein